MRSEKNGGVGSSPPWTLHWSELHWLHWLSHPQTAIVFDIHGCGCQLVLQLFEHINSTVAKMWRSLSIKLCVPNSTINKAGPRGPSFVAPGLLFSRVVRYLGKLHVTHRWPLKVHRELTLMICMSISHVSKWNRVWLFVFVRGVDKLNVQLSP